MDLSKTQGLYLQTVFDYFHEHGKWPTFKYVDRRLTHIRRDLDIAEITKGLPTGFANVFAFNHDLSANAILSASAISVCNGSQEDLAAFIRVIIFCVEKYFTSEEETIEITSEELTHQLGLSDLSIFKIGLLIKDANEYPIYQSFGYTDSDCSGWRFTLSRNIRYFDGVTSIEAYLTKIEQLRKPSAASKTQSQASHMSVRVNDRGTRKSFSSSAALE